MHANNSEFGMLKISLIFDGCAARLCLQPLISHLVLLFSIQIKLISTVFFLGQTLEVQNLQILWELIRLYVLYDEETSE